MTPVSCLFLNKPFLNLDRESSRGKNSKIISVLKWLHLKGKACSRVEILGRGPFFSSFPAPLNLMQVRVAGHVVCWGSCLSRENSVLLR